MYDNKMLKSIRNIYKFLNYRQTSRVCVYSVSHPQRANVSQEKPLRGNSLNCGK